MMFFIDAQPMIVEVTLNQQFWCGLHATETGRPDYANFNLTRFCKLAF